MKQFNTKFVRDAEGKLLEIAEHSSDKKYNPNEMIRCREIGPARWRLASELTDEYPLTEIN